MYLLGFYKHYTYKGCTWILAFKSKVFALMSQLEKTVKWYGLGKKILEIKLN